MSLIARLLLNIPATWEVIYRVDLIEPRTRIDAPLASRATAAVPRSNVIIQRRSSQHAHVEQARRELLRSMKTGFAGLRVLDESDFLFADGVLGTLAKVQFSTPDAVPLVQGLVFRLDEGILTQLTTTVAASRRDALDALLDTVVRTYAIAAADGPAFEAKS